MKNSFDTAGVIRFQQAILSAPQDFRTLQIQRIKRDFKNFLCEHFDFNERQLQQISQLSTEFTARMGAVIASSWGLGLPIPFRKDRRLTDEDAKDIILSTTTGNLSFTIGIWIRYRSAQADCLRSEPEFVGGNFERLWTFQRTDAY